jgi:hypothetical protein
MNLDLVLLLVGQASRQLVALNVILQFGHIVFLPKD